MNESSLAKEEDKDEFFGNESTDSDGNYNELDSGLAVAESRAQNDRFRKIGYHEAYEAAKEERLQEGFEDGYLETFAISKEVGAWLGKMAMNSKILSSASSSSNPDAQSAAPTASANDSLKKSVKLIRDRLTADNIGIQDLHDLKEHLLKTRKTDG